MDISEIQQSVKNLQVDEEVIRAYIRNQELADRQLEQFELKIQQPKIQSNVQTSLKTAFGGSRSNLQLC